MGTKQPVVTGKALIKILERLGFSVVRIKGSHHRMRHADGRVTTVPVHASEEIPTGLLRKIVRDDLGMTMEEFAALLHE
jgi:predicted RNA binding protein YcfA (HicA-like mRNA interferase family)